MAVYVDMPMWRFGRMVMCHMFADSREELDAMADRIGVARRWIQYPGTHREHYDIAKSKRALAVKAGAIELDLRGAGELINRRREAFLAASGRARPDGEAQPPQLQVAVGESPEDARRQERDVRAHTLNASNPRRPLRGAVDRRVVLGVAVLALTLAAAAVVDRYLGHDAPFPPGFEALAGRAAWCADRPARPLAGVGFTVARHGIRTNRGESVAQWFEAEQRFEFRAGYDTVARQQLHELAHFHRHDTPDSGHPTYVATRCPELGDAWY